MTAHRPTVEHRAVECRWFRLPSLGHLAAWGCSQTGQTVTVDEDGVRPRCVTADYPAPEHAGVRLLSVAHLEAWAAEHSPGDDAVDVARCALVVYLRRQGLEVVA